jgi:SAM-dependent methyltransferase
MDDYWERRKKALYYRISVDLAHKHAPQAKSVLDVGSRNCEYVRWCDWIPRKVAIDIRPFTIPGVTMVQGDFLEYRPEELFDLVFCMQVLEHLEDPTSFGRRLLEAGKVVVVSVPNRWPRGSEKSHVQDPVDEGMLDSWMGLAPIERVLEDRRIMAVYQKIGTAERSRTSTGV